MIDFVEKVPIDEVTGSEYNPRSITPEALEALQHSIRRFGMVKPLIVNASNNVITAGHQRKKAATAIGLEYLPCIRINSPNLQDEILFNLMHNSIETSKTTVRVEEFTVGGYHYCPSDKIKIESEPKNVLICSEITKLMSRYGEWGSIVTDGDGNVILNSEYAYCSKKLGYGVLCYAIRNEDVPEFLECMGVEYGKYVKSVSFISAKLSDNKAMMKHDPGYMGALRAMSEFDQEQLLNGNWKIRRSAGHYFKRSKIGQMFHATPTDVVRWVRAWDLAATSPEEADELDGLPQALRKNSRSDSSAYTAGVLLGKRRNGRIFVADVINVRENGADVRKLILNTAQSDNALYGNVTVRLPQDPGQAGKDQAQSFVRMLGGFTVTTSLESGDKVTRAEPFSSQWLAGNVDVKIAEWNDDYFRQLENFPVGKLKDMVDASANAYLELENSKPEFGFSFS